MSFLVYIVFVGDERYGVTALFTSLRAAEASSSRMELARALLDVLFAKEEQAVSGVGNRANERQLDQLKMDALRSKLSALLCYILQNSKSIIPCCVSFR